ncbi:MAG: DUF1285 domain-containing protein [Pseudomonadota bacterium]
MADVPLKSSPETVPDALKALNDLIATIAPDGLEAKTLPPVHLWNPENVADIGMEIRADGSWWHEGTKFTRMKLVKLFSRILRVDDDGKTYLVTPYEKVIVHVEDAPFTAVRVDRTGTPGRDQTLVFTTNLDDFTIASPETPLDVSLDSKTGEPSPYVNVRARLMAKLSRPTYYDLAEFAEPSPEDPELWGVWSRGVFFPIGLAP